MYKYILTDESMIYQVLIWCRENKAQFGDKMEKIKNRRIVEKEKI